jgi:flagellar biosynthesis protein FlhB
MEEPRLYEPTEQHLRRLRERARGPHSALARGVAVLAGALGLGLAGWIWARREFEALFWAASQHGTASVGEALAWAEQWGKVALALTAAVCAVLGLAAVLGDALSAGFGWGRQRLTLGGLCKPERAMITWLWFLAVAIIALGAMASIGHWTISAMVLRNDVLRLGTTMVWRAMGGAMIVAVALGFLDVIVSRARFRGESRMSRAEFLDDQRESRGHWLTLWRRQRRMWRRRRM